MNGQPIDDAFETAQAIDFTEHAAYQNAQVRAFAEGRINLDEARTVYHALGEHGSANNGGWARRTDLATKLVVAQFVGELLNIS